MTSAISTTWNVANLERETIDGYVFTVHYTVNATDGTYKAGAYGSAALERPKENLIPYSDLTEVKIIGWVKSKLGNESVASIEQALQNQINEQCHPTKASGVPWQ